MGKHNVARRIGALVVAGSMLGGGAVLAAAGPAGASNDHPCGLFGLHDNGPVTDVVHHSVEPLLGDSQPGVHATNCHLRNYEDILLNPERQDGIVQILLDALGGLTG
jgi:hypothetical protein